MKDRWIWTLIAVLGLAMALFLAGMQGAFARWKPEYGKQPQAVRDWYESRETTAATRKRLGVAWYISCCNHSDVVQAEFSKRDGKWYYRLPGDKDFQAMPQDVVQEGIETPTGEPTMFVDATGRNFGPMCFFPGGAKT